VNIIDSHRKITPHGGLIPILKKLKEFGIPGIIRSELGERVKQAKFGHDDILYSLLITELCGGFRLKHISDLEEKIKFIPGLKIPSHDSLGYGLKKLAVDDQSGQSVTKSSPPQIVKTDYNDNTPLNRTLVKVTKRLGALKKGISYTMDIDATFIPTERRGAFRPNEKDTQKKSSHSRIGFNPMVCSIGSLVTYVSMRNGDAGARFGIIETVQNSLSILNAQDIRVGRIVSDAAGYNKELFKMLDQRNIKFLTRFPYGKKMKGFNKALPECANWRKTEIYSAYNHWPCEVGDIYYKMYDTPFEKKTSPNYRVVAMRKPTDPKLKIIDKDEFDRKDRAREKMKLYEEKNLLKKLGKSYNDKHWKRVGDYVYKFFVTNDFETSCEDLILEYNNIRGNAERNFSILKNDYGWRIPPFFNMKHNAVFLLAAAMTNNVYRGLSTCFKGKIKEIDLKARLPKFRKFFINNICEILENKMFDFFNMNSMFKKIM